MSPALSALPAEQVAGLGVQFGMRSVGGWPVHPALSGLLPGGLPRGGTVTVTGSVSVLLAVVGAASAAGAWCALIGLPPIGAEAALGFGVVPDRTPVVDGPGRRSSPRTWAGLIAAMVDAVDVVAARPSVVLPAGDLSRLAARARSKDATLLLYRDLGTSDSGTGWAGSDVQLSASERLWRRAEGPRGRLVARRLAVTAQGRGRFARASSAGLWLPDDRGGVTEVISEAGESMPSSVVRLARPR